MPPLIGWASAADDDPRNPWFSWDYVRQNIDSLTAALEQHVSADPSHGGVAAVIAIPLAVLAYQVGWLTGPILARVRGALHHPVAGAVRVARPVHSASPSTPSSSDWCSTRCWRSCATR